MMLAGAAEWKMPPWMSEVLVDHLDSAIDDPRRLDSLQPDELICPCLKSMSGLSLAHP